MTVEPINAREPKRTGRHWLDMVVALSALLISTVSIILAHNSNQSMERLVRASSWPFIQTGSSNVSDAGERELAFGVTNVGTGPARVYGFQMTVDGAPLPAHAHLLSALLHACCEAEFSAAIEQVGGEHDATGDDISSPIAPRFLAPNESVYVFRWAHTEQNADLWRALDQARQQGRIAAAICYCSVFDDCWVARSDAFPPVEVDSCSDTVLL